MAAASNPLGNQHGVVIGFVVFDRHYPPRLNVALLDHQLPGFHYYHVRFYGTLSEPVPIKGQLGSFELPDEVMENIRQQYPNVDLTKVSRRAISVSQPFAACLVLGVKKGENRKTPIFPIFTVHIYLCYYICVHNFSINIQISNYNCVVLCFFLSFTAAV